MLMGRKFNDLSGQRFGRWSVVSFSRDVPRKNDHGRYFLWNCRCDCGNEGEVNARNLRRGDSQSCGCYQKEQHAKLVPTHGDTRERPPEYAAWAAMISRCSNQNLKQSWPHYGGRGITVCQRWRNSYEAFLQDIGRKPSPDLTLDRIDNNGNYEPGNVRWATWKEQNNNQRPRRKRTA